MRMVRMERHKCKLCSRSFSSGRALGGHMRSHLATLPLPPKTPQKLQELRQPEVAAAAFGGGGGESTLSSTSDECCSGEEKGNINFGFSTNEDQKGDDVVYGYGLRKNPKQSFRSEAAADLDDAGSGGFVVAVHDGESEAESTKKPTRRRSKRSRRTTVVSSTESMAMVAELEQVSSVSNITNNSPDEDLAMCLIMLSRDVWNTPTTTRIVSDEYCSEKKPMIHKSEKICKNQNKNKKMKMKIDCWEEEVDIDNVNGGDDEEELEEVPRNVVCRRKPKFLEDKKVHECPFCGKVFGSGQALGGHKRSHFLGSTTTTTITTTASVSLSVSVSVSNSANKFQHGGGGVFLIDLNLPAPMEEEDEDVHDHDHQEVSAVS